MFWARWPRSVSTFSRFAEQVSAAFRIAPRTQASCRYAATCFRFASIARRVTYPIRTHALQMGFEHPLGIGAGSLAMLAALSDAEVEEAIAANEAVLLERYPNLPPERVRADVALTRQRGYSLNPGLIVANSWGVGVAFHFPDGRLAGALSIAAIDTRMQEIRQIELAGYLKQEVARIEEKLAVMFSARTSAAEKPQMRRQTR